MISKNEIKQYRALHQKKHRSSEGLMIMEGHKCIEEALQRGAQVVRLFVTESVNSERIAAQAEVISAKQMDQLSGMKTPPGCLAVIRIPVSPMPGWSKLANEKLLLLDSIRDPGNLGTLIRTADWYGINHVFVSPGTVEPYNSKVLQSTMGSIFGVGIWEMPLVEVLEELTRRKSGYPIYGAVLGGGGISQLNGMPNGSLIIGSESHGISDELLSKVTHRVTIPGTGRVESLNAAVSAGILMNEWCN